MSWVHGYSRYSKTDPDDDLPASPQFNAARHIRRLNRRKAAEALPPFTTRALRLCEIEGVMRTDIQKYYAEGLDEEYARLEQQLETKR